METVTLTIDGQPVTVEKGKTVLQAADRARHLGPLLLLPPGHRHRRLLPRLHRQDREDGRSCRRRARPSAPTAWWCRRATPEVVEARAGVFEFLLVNHPLDCPVCDKGGECPLQDFSYTFGPDQSRMEFPRRVFDGEGVKADVDFGPTLMLNRNRCILCTRCVRFMRDVDGDAQINIIDRGYGSEIATFQEEGVHSLLSGNLMDVCPVGAITTRDYRFKSRPWDNPNAADTICTQCAKGCNITAWIKAKPEWAKGSRLIRFTPRFNPDVNGYWMCDIGRFDYHWIEGDDRLRKPLRDDAATCSSRSPWHDAIATLSRPARAPPARRPTRTACASCSRRTRRTRSCSCSAASPRSCSAPTARARSPWLAVSRRSRSRRARSSRCRAVDAPNVNGARLLGLAPGDARRRRSREADLSALRAGGRGRTRVGALRLRSGPRRLARRRRVDRRRARARGAAAADRPGRAADAICAGRRFRAAGRILRREGSVLYQRQGRLQGTLARDSAAGRGAWKTGRFS